MVGVGGCTKIIIKNKRPIDDPEHVYESDPHKVRLLRLQHLNKNRAEHEHVKVDHLPNELDDFEDNAQFETYHSTSTCLVSDIEGIIYGGLSSRFWMLRKLFNTYDKKCINNGELPYYAWECITL